MPQQTKNEGRRAGSNKTTRYAHVFLFGRGEEEGKGKRKEGGRREEEEESSFYL